MASLSACEYKTGRTLGQGSYATVKEAVHISTGVRYAVKIISKKLMAGKESMIVNEIEVLKKVSRGHANIVTLHDYFETPNNLYLVMDLCLGGELFDKICEKGHFYEEDAADLIRVVVDAVGYLHDQNIVHRDIKPENMMFRSTENERELVIGDFGLSKMMDPDTFNSLMTTCGTPGYMAPEVIRKTGHGKPVDMWSIGVLAFFLLCGYTPFDGNSGPEEMHQIFNAQYSFDPIYWDHISLEAKDFIRSCLLVNPQSRLTARQALSHPWLAQSQLRAHGMPNPSPASANSIDLLPNVRQAFNAKKTFRRAVDTVRATVRLSSTNLMDISPAMDAGTLEQYRPLEDVLDSNGNLYVNAKQ